MKKEITMAVKPNKVSSNRSLKIFVFFENPISNKKMFNYICYKLLHALKIRPKLPFFF